MNSNVVFLAIVTRWNGMIVSVQWVHFFVKSMAFGRSMVCNSHFCTSFHFQENRTFFLESTFFSRFRNLKKIASWRRRNPFLSHFLKIICIMLFDAYSQYLITIHYIPKSTMISIQFNVHIQQWQKYMTCCDSSAIIAKKGFFLPFLFLCFFSLGIWTHKKC